MLVIAWNIKIIKKNHNFDAGLRVLGFEERGGKIYYKIQEDISKKI